MHCNVLAPAKIKGSR